MIKITSNDYKGPTWAFIFCAIYAYPIMRRVIIMLMISCVIYILAFVVIMSCIKAGKDYDNEMQEILDAHLEAQKRKEELNRKVGN